jgi:predicted ATP-grasp superfamily ATP-dependent carboligase
MSYTVYSKYLLNQKHEIDLNILIKQLILATDEVVIQEIIPGPDSNLTLYTSYRRLDGAYFAEFTGRKLRQYPPGFGSASCACSCEEVETANLSRRILDELNYEGIAATEFKVDARDGSLKVIEINARPGLWYELTSGSNVKCILAYYKILTGSEFSNIENEQINGVCWKYGAKDLYTKIFYLFKGKFFLLGRPTSIQFEQVKTVYPVFDIKDIRPFISEFNVYLKKIFKKFSH